MLSSRDVRQCSTIRAIDDYPSEHGGRKHTVAANRSALCHSVDEYHVRPVPNWLATLRERIASKSFYGHSIVSWLFLWLNLGIDGCPVVAWDECCWNGSGEKICVPRRIDRVPVSRWLKRYKEGCELYLLLGLRGLWIHWKLEKFGKV